MTEEKGRFPSEGVRDAEATVHPFRTDDGLRLTWTRFRKADSDDVVVLHHGLTSSSDMFVMPEHVNLVRTLHASGFSDVWCLDSRMSNHFPYNLRRHAYSLDDVALYDHPAALRELRRQVGDRRVHVIAHCLGSLTFSMSLFAGTVGKISSFISNSVSLTPRVPPWSRVKLTLAPTLIRYLTPFAYVDPRWRSDRGLSPGRMLSRLVSLFHPECDNPACHMVSFMWGSGHPAVYQHENLDPRTHDRIDELFGATSMSYYFHVRKMVQRGEAVRFDSSRPQLPARYLASAAEVETPILFVTGDRNGVFSDSNVVCQKLLEGVVPGRHQLRIFSGYGHQDVLMGKSCDRDVFPTFVEFLRQQRDRAALGRSADAA